MNFGKIGDSFKKIWKYLKKDTWDSWLVSILLLYLFIRIIFFPVLGLITGTSLPLVVVESCSMYHGGDFNSWWAANGDWYMQHNITKEEFQKFGFENGLNKGDIIFVVNRGEPKEGDILIFNSNTGSTAAAPTIHRIISESPLATKGDNNLAQLVKGNNVYGIDETDINQTRVIGKALFRIPFLGWLKLIWFEPFRPAIERGFCTQTEKFKITN